MSKCPIEKAGYKNQAPTVVFFLSVALQQNSTLPQVDPRLLEFPKVELHEVEFPEVKVGSKPPTASNESEGGCLLQDWYLSPSQKEDKKTTTTTSAVHAWTAFRYSGRSWARQLFDPTGALLATLTGALHRGCTPAPTPKLLPARGRVQGFMEAYWTNFLEEFKFCLPDNGSWKNLHSVKFGCLKRCLWWGVSVIIVDKIKTKPKKLQNKSQIRRHTDI